MREWGPRPYRRFLAPKRPVSFRHITQLDPLENLAFSSLIRRIGPALEAIRVPREEQVVFSWRFEPTSDGQMFDPAYTWSAFNGQCRAKASSGKFGWVVVTDIADFFPRLYFHPLEQAVAAATNKSDEAWCVLRMVKNWNSLVSYGLPVGVAASRILAEATIADVDRMLLGAGESFCRYSDDYRIFSGSEVDARNILEELAACLFDKHGLTLQPEKTLILSAQEYLERFDVSPERAEVESLSAKFRELLEEAGIEDYAEEIEYDDLPEHIQAEIDQLNLSALLREQLRDERCDSMIVSFLLRRLGSSLAVFMRRGQGR